MYLCTQLNPGVSDEYIMYQFIYGPSVQIRFKLQRCTYNDLEELFQQAILIELNTKKKSMATQKILRSKTIQEDDHDLRTNHFEEGEYDEDL